MHAKRYASEALAIGLVLGGGLWAADPRPSTAPGLTCQGIEAFLREATIGVQKNTPKGVTQPKHAIFKLGEREHDAHIQTIHEAKSEFKSDRTTELNFKDFWEFNIAGYELAKILEINMVPPYVERQLPGGKRGSVTWTVDGILEAQRVKENLAPPNLEDWNRQIYVLRVFDQLIRDTDANLTNFVITPDWQLWRFDFTRAFRPQKDLLSPKDLVQCDRKLLANLRKLNKALLQEKLGRYIDHMQIDGLLARRDKIVEFFDAEIAQKGETAVLFDSPRVGQACGVGL